MRLEVWDGDDQEIVYTFYKLANIQIEMPPSKKGVIIRGKSYEARTGRLIDSTKLYLGPEECEMVLALYKKQTEQP